MNFAGGGFARKAKEAVVPLVEQWLDGLRMHQCLPVPRAAGVSVTTK
jgi:hypothetical protein